MGIYIKDYKIPNGECEHLVLDFENMTAFAAFGDRKHYELIEVTKPHGDLVDRDEIDVLNYEDADGFHTEISASTVIEAEGE